MQLRLPKHVVLLAWRGIGFVVESVVSCRLLSPLDQMFLGAKPAAVTPSFACADHLLKAIFEWRSAVPISEHQERSCIALSPQLSIFVSVAMSR